MPALCSPKKHKLRYTSLSYNRYNLYPARAQKSPTHLWIELFSVASRRPTLPGPCGPSTIGAGKLNFCVRDGNRCDLSAIITRHGNWMKQTLCVIQELRISPRPISTGQLNASRHVHLQPINPVVYRGSYHVDRVGSLILRGASRLDAFSAYPFPT